MADEVAPESLTPNSDALRDLLNLSDLFGEFVKMRPILERVAEAESAIPAAKTTLDELLQSIGQAQTLLNDLTEKHQAQEQRGAEALVTLNQKYADQAKKLREADLKGRTDYEQKLKQYATAIQAADDDHARALANMAKAEAEAKARLAALQAQITSAERRLSEIGELVKGKP